MVGLFERLFGRSGQDKSGKLAKDRLQFVLVQDRIQLPAEKMKEMQKEIIEVISKYVTVDMDNVDFELSNRERDGLLIAEIPFKSAIVEPPAIEEPALDGDIKISVEETPPEATEPEAVVEQEEDLADSSQPVAEVDTTDETAPTDITEVTETKEENKTDSESEEPDEEKSEPVEKDNKEEK